MTRFWTELRFALRLDLRQHGLSLALLWLGSVALGLLVLAVFLGQGEGATAVLVLPFNQRLALFLFVHAAASRLVRTDQLTGEFQALRALPLRLWVFWLVRFALLVVWQLTAGLTLLTVALIGTAASTWSAEALGRMFWVCSLGSFFVAIVGWFFALLGRYQVPAAGITLFVAMGASDYLGVPFDHLPGVWFSSDSALESLQGLATVRILEGALAGAALALGSTVLLAHRQGQTVELLAAPMNNNQRVATMAVALSAVLFSITLSDFADDGTYTLKGAEEHVLGGIKIRVSKNLQTTVPPLDAQQLAPLATALEGWPVDESWPTVYLIRSFDLDGDSWQVKEQEDEDALVVQIDPDAPGFATERIASWVAMSLVDAHTRDRSSMPEAWWLSRGMAMDRATELLEAAERVRAAAPQDSDGVDLQDGEASLAHGPPDMDVSRDPAPRDEVPKVEDLPTDDVALSPREQMWGCARRHRDDQDLDASVLFHRDLLRERIGERSAVVVAGSLVHVLASLSSREALTEITETRWRQRPPRGILAMIYDRLSPIAKLIPQHTGIDQATLVSRWHQTLDSLPEHVLAVVEDATLPSVPITFREPNPGQFRLVATLDAGPDPSHPVQVRYAEIDAFDRPLALGDTRTLSRLATDAPRPVETDESWPRGTRMAWRVERWSEPLQCWLTTPWTRSTL